MINFSLFEFQSVALDELMNFCISEPKSSEHIVLQAPTGSGKTIILSSFIDSYLDTFPNTVVFWLSPGKGGLEEQSRKSFDKAISGRISGDLLDFMQNDTSSGHIYFINWELITGKTNIVLKEAEWKNLFDKINNYHVNNIEFLLIIDEEHSHDTAKAAHIIGQLNPVQEIRASATANTKRTNKKVIVKETEVIEAGLIAEAISVNADLNEEIVNNEILELLELSNKKRNEVVEEYKKINVKINPLVLIQFPNGEPDTIESVVEYLKDMGFSEEQGTVARWFSDDKSPNIAELNNFNSEINFLLFKQAIATGWDCPRAKILVKLREGGEERFNVQTIGRIRRMPEQKHYENAILDKCYLYTRDSEFELGLKETYTSTSYLERTHKRKQKNVTLKKEYIDNPELLINESELFESIKTTFINKYDDNNDGFLSSKELLRHGFILGYVIQTPMYSGLVHTLEELSLLSAKQTSYRTANTHIDGFVFKRAIREIANSSSLSENSTKLILSNLFDKLPPVELFPHLKESYDEALTNRLYYFESSKEYYAFIINNTEKLKKVFKESDVQETLINKGKEHIKQVEWSIPFYQSYRYDHLEIYPENIHTNVFEDYKTSSLTTPLRSSGEVLFERWCERNSNIIDFYYNNGDKGSKYFSFTYKTRFQIRNSYPDYILVLKNGDIWILEVKGGIMADGSSANRDQYASHKFVGLKEYIKNCNNNKLYFGFLRPHLGSLKLSTTDWNEDINDMVWVPIGQVISG